MSVTLKIHPYLRKFADGLKEIELEGRTVGECIDALAARFPETRERLCDEQGNLHSFWEIYLNSDSCYPDELATPVKDGDELTIVSIMAGG
jgi:molybdopterin converting factor small subunit